MSRFLASSTAARLLVVVTFVLLAGSMVAMAATEGGGHGGEHGRILAPVLHPDTFATDSWPPAAILVIGGVGILLLPSRIRGYAAVILSAITLWYVWNLPDGARLVVGVGGQDLTLLRVDRLSLVFGKIFSLIGIIAGIYALHQRDTRQQVAALLYNAGALGVTFAGDYLTLYVFWELMAVSSVVLIWARRNPESEAAGRRYILVHLVGGAVLLGGVLLHLDATGSIAFERFAPGEGGLAAWLILIGFCLNAAVPPLGPWLPDAYPRATVTGAIFCSALTTKTAVYTLIRGFTGWEILAVAGVVMALYGVVYAVLANDIRELLGYHIISQVGYMVAGVGIGTAMAVNGAAAHAVSHILYKALLFMGAGVVIHTTGREKLTELGGFWKRQKLVFGLYMIGAFSISGFPLWNGFISKSMVVAAAGELHWDWAFLLLMLASVGTFLHTGLKLPYGTWMGEDHGIRPKPAPVNMVVAMAVAAFFCTIMGVAPGLLYAHLPYEVHWDPWTAPHVMEAVQMLLFTFFVFYLFIPKLGGQPTISMDTDVLYRKPAPAVRAVFVHGVGAVFDGAHARVHALASRLAAAFRDPTDWIPGWPERVESDEPGYDEDRARLPLMLPFTLTLIAFGVIAGWRFLG
ncbi:MAG TPA: Na(+)/H(+) antiporter subunit D [Candidatus Krumholzibacteria bacterium]|nr:Na(+)/H(+) antiporter subunit D [Candidatus Krumholzibacteria bacterium]